MIPDTIITTYINGVQEKHMFYKHDAKTIVAKNILLAQKDYISQSDEVLNRTYVHGPSPDSEPYSTTYAAEIYNPARREIKSTENADAIWNEDCVLGGNFLVEAVSVHTE